jgi:hypothetical protein
VINEFYTGRSPKAHERFQHQVEVLAKDATIVHLGLEGNQVAVISAYFAVTSDGAIKAVWLDEALWTMVDE